MGKKTKNKRDFEYTFEHGKCINYTLDGVSTHPDTTKIQVFFLTQLPEGTKPLKFNGWDIKTGWINNIVVTPQY